MTRLSLDSVVARGGLNGPLALIFCEDAAEVDSTLAHHLAQGFGRVLAFLPDAMSAPALDDARLCLVSHNTPGGAAVRAAVNAVARAAPGAWIYWGFNAEYLFFPFCETRTIRDMTTFHAEERRDAMPTFVIDLYPRDLARAPDGVDRAAAMLDARGYFGLGRSGEGGPRERQLDFFGGLRWRFEEFFPPDRRRIDRIGLFRAIPGAELLEGDVMSIEEMNTFACPWHNNLTAAVASFRVAKALRTNPDPRARVTRLGWRGSVPFRWHSQQLMDLGLMEPGQWF
jgi:hypothetical protein